MTTSRADRDAERREAYEQRLAYLATGKGQAAARRRAAKEHDAQRDRERAYEQGARGGTAHHHIPGGRIRRAAKVGQRARRAARMVRHDGDPRTWRQRAAGAWWRGRA